MRLSKGATVAVVDGEKLLVFRNSGDESGLKLTATPTPALSGDGHPSGASHQSSSANPDNDTQEEDSFAAAVGHWLNKQVLENKIETLVVVAAPKTLGELRKHYHKRLQAVLEGELAKDLAGRPVAEIETAISHA